MAYYRAEFPPFRLIVAGMEEQYSHMPAPKRYYAWIFQMLLNRENLPIPGCLIFCPWNSQLLCFFLLSISDVLKLWAHLGARCSAWSASQPGLSACRRQHASRTCFSWTPPAVPQSAVLISTNRKKVCHVIACSGLGMPTLYTQKEAWSILFCLKVYNIKVCNINRTHLKSSLKKNIATKTLPCKML